MKKERIFLHLKHIVLCFALLLSCCCSFNVPSSRKIDHCSVYAHKTGVIIVDHGSKKMEANEMLLEVVKKYKVFSSKYGIVEPAHMEIAEPSIPTAYRRCVEQGATHIICHPYFLSQGKHVQEDIPAILSSVSREYPSTTYHITKPLGQLVHKIVELIDESIEFEGT